MSWWQSLWVEKAKDWTFGYLEPNQTPHAPIDRKLIAPDAEYFNVFLRTARIVNVRKGLSRFYGAVHSFISVPHLDGKPAQFHVLNTPDDLRDVDATNIDRVVNLNKRLVGPIPYRGGDIELEVGLFSIKSSDLAGPFLNVLQGISQVANVAYINAALPFVSPLLDGIKLLTGTQGDAVLEIGLANTLPKPETGHFVVMRAPKGSVKISDLRLDSDNRLLNTNGQALGSYPYLVFAIEASRQRENWFEIPDILAAHKQLKELLRQNKDAEARDVLAVFRRTVLTSPDLLSDDGFKLVKQIEDWFGQITGTATPGAKAIRQALPELHQVKLFN